MSGVGFSELLVLFLIGLIVLGPERLPRVANQLGTWLGQARRMTRVMKRQLEDELSLEEKQSTAKKASVSHPSYVSPANATDETYSPMHGPDEPGTGVGVNIDDEMQDKDIAAADAKNLDQDVDSAIAGTEPEKKEKIS
jgi:sec-independent protein translocase protein TatB